jgi:hypothetical protein
MVNKVTIKELYKETFRRSTLISIPMLTDFFEIPDSEYTKWEVFYGIVKEAVRRYDVYYPLNLIQKLYINVDKNTRIAYLTDNFDAYVEGIIDQHQAVVLPSAIMGLAVTAYTASGYPMRNFRYEPPELRDFWYNSGVWYANTLCRHPMYEEYDQVSKDPTDRCAVYYMNKDAQSAYTVFLDHLYVEVCRYIVNMRKNMMLPNLPIELFQGLEDDYQKVENKLETLHMNSLTRSEWLI